MKLLLAHDCVSLDPQLQIEEQPKIRCIVALFPVCS